MRDLDEYYVDLQLLRVTKRLQEVLKGEQGSADDREAAQRTEARIGLMAKTHDSAMRKAKADLAKTIASVRERREENRHVRGQLSELEGSVAARAAIHKSRMEATGGHSDPAHQAAQRMKRITTRRRLIDLAKSQTSEIEILKQELDRLRQRTFPSFIHAARERMMGPDEVF